MNDRMDDVVTPISRALNPTQKKQALMDDWRRFDQSMQKIERGDVRAKPKEALPHAVRAMEALVRYLTVTTEFKNQLAEHDRMEAARITISTVLSVVARVIVPLHKDGKKILNEVTGTYAKLQFGKGGPIQSSTMQEVRVATMSLAGKVQLSTGMFQRSDPNLEKVVALCKGALEEASKLLSEPEGAV